MLICCSDPKAPNVSAVVAPTVLDTTAVVGAVRVGVLVMIPSPAGAV